MNKSLCQYYRCPENLVPLSLRERPSGPNGYFRFGESTLYGQLRGHKPSSSPTNSLEDITPACVEESGQVFLPFDPTQITNNLRYESYVESGNIGHPASSLVGRAYYLFRPLMPVALRKHLQKLRLNGWRHLPFPEWPVDRTVEHLMESVLLLSLRAQRLREIPFIWFWPEGASSCAIVTHDVETPEGRDFCKTLMDVNESFGVHASFQVVPESRYDVPDRYLQEIRTRGFEVNVQDLNHDGFLFRDKEEFSHRVRKINAYGRRFKSDGFRSAVLYRRQEWFDALEFEYDMSVPNVAHLDPQRGGCCTVMPYFIGELVELPVTTTQDYSLFNILGDHSIDLWRQQINLIMAKHGLMTFIIHPDYIVGAEEMKTYKSLLRYLTQLAAEKNVWLPLPREVASWWRDRSNMTLVQIGGEWKIEGKGSDRARVAYASEKDGKLVYSFQSQNAPSHPVGGDGAAAVLNLF